MPSSPRRRRDIQPYRFTRVTDRRHLLASGFAVASAALLPRLGDRAGAQSTPAATPSTQTTTFAIPGERVFPEGVAYDPATNMFYVGSTENGTIYRGDLATGVVEPFLPGGQDERTEVTGLKVDEAGRLVVCGRRTGRIFAYDTASGALLARYWNGRTGGTLINDVAVTTDGSAYVTDSFAPLLYRVDLSALPLAANTTPAAAIEEQESDVFLDVTDSPFVYADDFNANGIVATQDGAALLIVQFNTGRLYRVELESRAVAEVPLVGGDLRGGDGLALDGTTLWALLDTTGELVRVELDPALSQGKIVSRLTDPTFAYPTTLALVGDGTALVVNSQLDMAGDGSAVELPFTVSRLVLPA